MIRKRFYRAPSCQGQFGRRLNEGLASLDLVDLKEVFESRASMMRTVPLFLRGAFSAAVRLVVEALQLDGEVFLTCLRTARRGAAAGPSGMTADHLFSILESETDSELLVQVAS